MDLHEIAFKLTGITPLLQHNAAAMQRPKEGPKVKKIPTPEEEAEAGCYRDDQRRFVHPAAAARSALLSAAKQKKIGKKGAVGVVSAAVLPAEEWMLLIDPDTNLPLPEYKIDTRRAVVQRSGVFRSRPRHERWACVIRFQLDMEILTPEHVQGLLEEAGVTVGMGDFRPEKRGIFGRFVAERIEK